MKTILLANLVLILIGCSTSKKKQDIELDGAQETDVPSWVYSPQSSCDERKEICASAGGDSSEVSDINARKSLASIFGTKIKSNFLIEKYGYTNAQAQSLSERVSDEVQESINVILSSVSISNRFEKDDMFFSQAKLDKVKAAQSLNLEIKSIDDQLDFLYKKSGKSSILKMHMLFDKRNILNEKMIVITGSSVSTQMSFSKINNLKYEKLSGNRIYIKSVNSVPQTLVKWVESLFTESGYTIVSDSKLDYLVKIKYFAKEEHIKVSGFKKFSFTLVLEAKNNLGDKLGVYTNEVVSTGRNEKNAYLKIKLKLQKMIKENLDKLNLK